MYKYEEQKELIFSDEGLQMLLKIKENIHKLIDSAGCCYLGKSFKGITGSSWLMIACVDYLKEIGDISEISTNTYSQYRIFTNKF